MGVTPSQLQWDIERKAIVDRMHAGGGKPGVAAAAAIAGRSGLGILQAMLRGEIPYPHIAETLDFALIEVEAGRAVFQGTPQLKHYNPMGMVHGGWYATLLDSALGCAVQSTLPAGRSYTTVELGHRVHDPHGPPTGHGRGAPAGLRRQDLCARDHHVPRVRNQAALSMVRWGLPATRSAEPDLEACGKSGLRSGVATGGDHPPSHALFHLRCLTARHGEARPVRPRTGPGQGAPSRPR